MLGWEGGQEDWKKVPFFEAAKPNGLEMYFKRVACLSCNTNQTSALLRAVHRTASPVLRALLQMCKCGTWALVGSLNLWCQVLGMRVQPRACCLSATDWSTASKKPYNAVITAVRPVLENGQCFAVLALLLFCLFLIKMECPHEKKNSQIWSIQHY